MVIGERQGRHDIAVSQTRFRYEFSAIELVVIGILVLLCNKKELVIVCDDCCFRGVAYGLEGVKRCS